VAALRGAPRAPGSVPGAPSAALAPRALGAAGSHVSPALAGLCGSGGSQRGQELVRGWRETGFDPRGGRSAAGRWPSQPRIAALAHRLGRQTPFRRSPPASLTRRFPALEHHGFG